AFALAGSQAVYNQTWSIGYRESGSSEWKAAPGEAFNIKVGKDAAALAPVPEGSQYEPYSIIAARYAVVNEDGADYVYFIVQTTDDVSKVKVSYVNDTTGKTKTATYQTTSTNVKSHVSDGKSSIWVIRMKLTAAALNDEYTIQCRGSSWGEGIVAVRSDPAD
ncbi:MAG: hypothetical protein IK097_02035, partial [Clostridia bacterium]|nr:hypothetical protein [Clostridia bacterium]